MSKDSINLKYASNSSAFFRGLNNVRGSVAGKDFAVPFGEADDFEIGRGESYAVFPELTTGENPITIERFRNALSDRGISDKLFQDKILFMLLQNRAGIQFRLGSSIMDVLSGRGGIFTLQEDYGLELVVNSNNSVDLVYTAKINEKNGWTGKATEAFNANVTINLSPEKVTIKDFDISKVNDNDSINQAFNALQGEQKNIIMKLLTYIKYALGFDSELRIEEKQEEESKSTPSV